MRLKNLTRSVSIILMLLAMMFSCQPVSEDVGSSNNGGSNSGNQNGGNAGDNDNENEGGNTGGGNNPAKLTLQNIIDNANAGDEIDLSAHKDLSGYNATVNKSLTIKNGNLNNATLTVTAENVKLDKLENVSVTTSSKLSVNNSKLNVLSVGATTETSRSTISVVEMSPAMVSVAGCEIENVELNGFNSQLNIVDAKTKIDDIITSTKAKIILEAGSYVGMKDPVVTDNGELTRIDMTKEKELSILSIYSNPKKTEYEINDEIDLTSLIVMGTYTASIEIFKSGGWKGEAMDSVTKWEDEKDYTLTCEKFDTAGVKIVTIESKIATGVKCYFNVYVKDPQTGEVPEAKISDIKLENAGPVKTSYLQGDKLDLSGILMTGICNGYKINLPYTSEPANGTTLTNVGEITVTFYYNGVQVNELPITVEETFTIDFYDGIDNSKPLYAQKVAGGEKPVRPSDPEREDYTFTGWYYDEACTQSAGYVFSEKVKGDIQLYAGWSKNVYIHDITIKVTNLPTEVKALSIWGSLNNYRLANIMADKDAYIVDVANGTAEFYFEKMNIGEWGKNFWCQFVPMTSKDMPMSDATWWQTAFSGSSEYANAENNLVYNEMTNKTTLTLNVEAVYGDVSTVFKKRFNTEDYMDAFQVSKSECKYNITYEGADEYSDFFITSFDEEYDVTLIKPFYKEGYLFAGWYETADFSGEPIDGWKAGEKKADVTLYAKWEKAKDIIIRFDVNGRDEETPNAIVTKAGETISSRKIPSIGEYFSHWNTKPDGSGKSYSRQNYEDVYFMEDTTLYAQWCKEVRITFKANGGSGSMGKQVIPENKYYYLSMNTFTPPQPGFFFSGWNTEADGSGESYEDGDGINITEDITLYAQWAKDVAVTGVYSYKLNIDEISRAWGATDQSTSFAILFMTLQQAQIAEISGGFNFSSPAYQLHSYGDNIRIDTTVTGDFKIYGDSPVNGEYKYYTGVASTVTDTTLEVFVDMSKISATELKSFWMQDGVLEQDLNPQYVDLTGYEPYVIALASQEYDPDNYIATIWSGDVMGFSNNDARFPTDPIGTAPRITTLSDMKYVCSNFGNFPITFTDGIATAEIVYSLENATWGQEQLGEIQFGVCIDENWNEKFTGANIYSFNTEATLTRGANEDNRVHSDILTDGMTYVLTIDANAGTVKITPKGAD